MSVRERRLSRQLASAVKAYDFLKKAKGRQWRDYADRLRTRRADLQRVSRSSVHKVMPLNMEQFRERESFVQVEDIIFVVGGRTCPAYSQLYAMGNELNHWRFCGSVVEALRHHCIRTYAETDVSYAKTPKELDIDMTIHRRWLRIKHRVGLQVDLPG